MAAPHVSVSVNTLLGTMSERLHSSTDAHPEEGREPLIKRLPAELRVGDLYDPKLVSIGPLHRGRRANVHLETIGVELVWRANYRQEAMASDHLEAMEAIKWATLRDLLYHYQQEPDRALKSLVNAIKPKEAAARSQYEEEIIANIGSNEFVMVMIVDGCFILEVLRMHWESGKLPARVHKTGVSPLQVLRDLLLLENQIPFFILAELYEQIQQLGLPQAGITLKKLAISYFSRKSKSERRPPSNQDEPPTEPIHLLHLYYIRLLHQPKAEKHGLISADDMLWILQLIARALRRTIFLTYVVLFLFLISPYICTRILPKGLDFSDLRLPEGYIPSAQQLRDKGGIVLKRAATKFDLSDVKGMLEVSFKIFDASIMIPVLYLDDLHKSLLANLRALEECLEEKTTEIRTYLWLMFSFTRTEEDAALLRKEEIVISEIGDDKDTVGYFRDVCKSKPEKFEWKDKLMFGALLSRYNSTFFRWRTSFMRNYLENPWAMFGLIASIVALFLTAVQTYYAAFPHNN